MCVNVYVCVSTEKAAAEAAAVAALAAQCLSEEDERKQAAQRKKLEQRMENEAIRLKRQEEKVIKGVRLLDEDERLMNQIKMRVKKPLVLNCQAAFLSPPFHCRCTSEGAAHCSRCSLSCGQSDEEKARTQAAHTAICVTDSTHRGTALHWQLVFLSFLHE
jgi:hypothetical protein